MKYRFDADREPVIVGCKHHDNCFTCPFAECKAGTRDGAPRKSKHKKQEWPELRKRAKEMYAAGMPMLNIASEIEASYKFVWNAVRGEKC